MTPTTTTWRSEPHAGFFVPHPNLSDEINRDVCQSEIEGGVFLQDLRVGAVLQVQTRNRSYFFQYCGNGRGYLRGHPKFCPEPVLVSIHGSTWGRSMIKTGFIGRGMHLEFGHPDYPAVLTSQVVEVRELPRDTAVTADSSVC